MVLAPGGHRGMLRGRDADAGHVRAVVLAEQFDGGKIISAQEIEEMRSAADSRGFAAAHAAETKIVQFVWQERGITSAFQGVSYGLFYGSAESSDRDGIPHLKQNGFRPVSQPVKLGIGIFDGDYGVLRRYYRAFFHGLDAQRQNTAILRVEILPSGIVEALRISSEMLISECFGLLDIFGGEHFAGKISLDDILQPGDFSVIEKTTARTNVRIDKACVRRVLPPVREFIAVGVEDRIKAKGLNSRLLKRAQ